MICLRLITQAGEQYAVHKSAFRHVIIKSTGNISCSGCRRSSHGPTDLAPFKLRAVTDAWETANYAAALHASIEGMKWRWACWRPINRQAKAVNGMWWLTAETVMLLFLRDTLAQSTFSLFIRGFFGPWQTLSPAKQLLRGPRASHPGPRFCKVQPLARLDRDRGGKAKNAGVSRVFANFKPVSD